MNITLEYTKKEGNMRGILELTFHNSNDLVDFLKLVDENIYPADIDSQTLTYTENIISVINTVTDVIKKGEANE